MKKVLSLLLLLLSPALSFGQNERVHSSKSPVDFVNVLMGTDSEFALSNGNTYPAIALPWGMNFWTPQTGKMGDGWMYTYGAHKIRGFKQTHQPSPWMNDYGQFALMPQTGKVEFDEEKRASWFSHKAETATPYYYSVYLADYDVTTEIAPTERAAIFRITYPETAEPHFIVDAFDSGSYIRIDRERNRIYGYSTKNSGGVPANFRNYFVLEFDTPFSEASTWSRGLPTGGGNEIAADHAGAVLTFAPTRRGQKVHVKAASSFIGFDQAELNLKEIGDHTFDEVKTAGKERWNEVLGRVCIEDENTDRIRTFYSCLYRSVLFPRAFYEIDKAGKVVHYSPYDGTVHDGYLFTDTGFWDTFRSLFPLVNLLYPSMGEKMQLGLLNAYRESGFFPEWASPGHRNIMIGNNSASVVYEGFSKGLIPDSVALEMYRGLLHGANSVHPEVDATGRKGYEYYNRLGYVPYDAGINENVARTLEYAYDDWCIYKMGKALGRPSSETDLYRKRSQNYRNVFDPAHNLMRGRNKDGSFQEPFSPLKWGDAFTEGNSWHYTWSVFHDIRGLIDLMGGKEAFVAMLDSVFNVPPHFDDSYYGGIIHEIREMQVVNMGNYAHGNQPIQHMIYLYDYAGAPWKTQDRVRQVMTRLYQPTPDGYCGDEDNGQTSAWYVFSALGFYPVTPGSNQYALGAPLFKKAVLHLESGQKVVIEAPKNSDTNRFVKTLLKDGTAYDRNYLDFESLRGGTTLRFEMSDRPDFDRGTAPYSAPYSYTSASKH